MSSSPELVVLAAKVIEAARAARVSIAAAESLTGGMVCDSLVSVPGASDVVRGGVVAYDLEAKVSTLGVLPALLEREGPVSQAVALAMARGARRAMSADFGVATTGVAGPEPHGGFPPGTVVIGIAGADIDKVTTFAFEGGREDVRAAATEAALKQLLAAILAKVG